MRAERDKDICLNDLDNLSVQQFQSDPVAMVGFVEAKSLTKVVSWRMALN
jgi:hypothetical protein